MIKDIKGKKDKRIIFAMSEDLTKRLKNVPDGSRHYRSFVGWPDGWDILSAMQFNLLTYLGLREDHFFLDIGCGSLRTGRLLIPYLLPGHYFGIEPEVWLLEEGIKNELGNDLLEIKAPHFSNDTDFPITKFGVKFDYIYAHSVFTHASPAQIKQCLSEAGKSMKPTSVFAATFSRGEKNYTGDEWVYPSYATYTLERISEYCSLYGLRCDTVKWSHRNQTLILITDPSGTVQIPRAIPDKVTFDALQIRLEEYQKKLRKLETNPCVKFCSFIRGTMQTVRNKLTPYANSDPKS